MPVLRFQCRLPRRNGVPEDDTVNTFVFDTDQTIANDADDIVGRLVTFYQTIDTYLSRILSGALIVKVYDLAVQTPRPVVYEQTAAFTPNTGNAPYPAEVAIKTTFIGRDPGDMPIEYRRGGVYLGPLSINAGGSDPSPIGDVPVEPGCRTAIADALQVLAKGPDLGDGRLAVYSPTWHLGRGPTSGGQPGGRGPRPTLEPHSLDGATNDVVSGWVDDAFDTQRRRGSDARTRTTFTVTD